MVAVEVKTQKRGVVDWETLVNRSATLKDQGKRVALCHGVFDLLHIGHIRHLQKARENSDVLIVTVTPDRYVNKGPGRPAFNEQLRAEALAALDCVDLVAINQWPMAMETIRSVKPSLYVKGSDYSDPAQDITGGILLERQAVEEVGGELFFTNEIVSSSSTLINRHLPPFPPKMHAFLEEFRTRYSLDQIRESLDQLHQLKVCVIGEAIIDEYHYCRTLGKAGKEPVLVAQYEKQEAFAGGILAVANHVAQVTDHVDVITLIGERDSYEAFIRENLDRKVTPHLLRMERGRTIVKRRFVESYPLQKLFEIYLMDDPVDSPALQQCLEERLADYDVVIVVDYGHHMLTEGCRNLLCEKSRFLAVNTQINAGNQGFNTVSKYPRADYICLSERELRMDARKKQVPLDEIMQTTAEQLQARQMLITRGSEGVDCFHTDTGFFEIPAFGGSAVDRIGAGDAVLAITSLCARLGVPIEVMGLIGNAVGYQAVQTVGNRRPVCKSALLKFFEHVLK